MSGATPTSTPSSGRRPSTNPPASTPAAQNRSPTPSSVASATSSSTPSRTSTLKSKTGAPPSAKAAVKKTTGKESSSKADEDAKAEISAVIEDLKEQLRKAETASEEYQKELQVAQSRLDEALSEQSKLEETANQHADTITNLESQLRDVSRQKADLDIQREADVGAVLSEREASASRERELQDVIQRLKDNLAQREPRRSVDGDGRPSRPVSPASAREQTSPNPDASLSPPAFENTDGSQNGSQLVAPRDKIIENLRLELAEAHIKVMEVERAGGGKLEELEKKLLETRVENAKLMEDNESYQFLLQERTLNGEFTKQFRATTPLEQTSREIGGSSLADELDADEFETASGAPDLEEAKERRTLDKAEKEIVALEDQNKALKLYIDKIIGKLLASDHYEAVLGGAGGSEENTTTNTTLKPPADDANKENAAPTLLQRAGSIFGNRTRPTPPSARQVSDSGPQTRNEDPSTAPSVPLRRGHHRASSASGTAASYTARPASSTNRPTTPTQTHSRHTSLSAASPPTGPTIMEDTDLASTEGITPDTSSSVEGRPSSSNGETLETSTSASSPPRSVGTSSIEGSKASGGAATVYGKQMRPLRLVQEKVEADAEKKKANRASWMGWFNNKGTGAPPPPSSLGSQGDGNAGSSG